MSNLHLKKKAWAWMDLRGDKWCLFYAHSSTSASSLSSLFYAIFFVLSFYTHFSVCKTRAKRFVLCVLFFFCLSMMLVTLRNVMRSNCKLLQLSQKGNAQKRNECTISTSCAITGHCIWESCARLVVVRSINLRVETHMGLQIML